MKATNILIEEHNVILKLLECTERIIAEAEAKGKLNAQAANTAIDFFRNFADRCHHAKEEDRLFIAMEAHGFPRDGGPTGVMLEEHILGRQYVGGMAEAVEKAAVGDAQAIRTFSENARNFIDLLQNHIAKENNVLFPMADQSLGETEMETMLADFKQIEADAGGDRHAKYIEVARELCEQYGVPFLEQSQIRTIAAELMS
jgi:hemerythrin-like domain-containing protein